MKKVSKIHNYLALHTKSSIFTLSLIFIYIGFCLFYFVSFALYQKTETLNTLFTSFGMNQVINVFIVQPLTLFVILYILNKVKELQEKCSNKEKKISFIEASNPIKNKYSTLLSNNFSYILFTHTPAKCSEIMFPKLFNFGSKVPIDIIGNNNSAVSLFIKNNNEIVNTYTSREISITSLYFIEKLL